MPIKVDKEKCTKCGNCEKECPGDLIRMSPKDGYPINAYRNDCWYCGVCEIECPKGALTMTFPTKVL